MSDKITETIIEGINPEILKVVTLENNGIRKWAIKNKFNQITPLFENVPYINQIDDKRLLIIGQINGRKSIYSVRDTFSKYEGFYKKVPTIGDIVYIKDVDENIAILTTDKGEYLFDKNTLKPKSDLFTTIAFLDNKLLFTKIMNHNGRDSYYYGNVSKDGVLGKYLYDEENNDFINTPIVNTENRGYEVLDEFKLDEILSKRSDNKSSIKKKQLKTLSRLNMATINK